MAKLDKKTAARVAENEGSSYAALPEGRYLGALKNVDASREGPAGPYWSWEFDVVDPDEFDGRKLWVNTSLSPDADWKMKEMFDAFGVGTDTDTDELISEVVVLIVSQRVIEKGARAGQIGNNVDNVLPFDGGDAMVTAGNGGKAKADDLM